MKSYTNLLFESDSSNPWAFKLWMKDGSFRLIFFVGLLDFLSPVQCNSLSTSTTFDVFLLPRTSGEGETAAFANNLAFIRSFSSSS